MTAASAPSDDAVSSATPWLRGQFLVAMPGMTDPRFNRSLIYLCDHSDQGAMGVVVNKPTDMTLATLFERIELPLSDNGLAHQPVMFGGPMQLDRAFVLHKPAEAWQSTLNIGAGIALTSSKDILAAVGSERAPQAMLVALGYAGWGSGQLDHEILQNAWLSVPADEQILFDLPYEERVAAALAKLGIGFEQLSDAAGHA